jgi:hypothetical protein
VADDKTKQQLDKMTRDAQRVATDDEAAAARAAVTPSPARASDGTVTVACKLPNGLYLKIYDMVDTQEMTPLGPRTIKMSRQVGDTHRINGFSRPFGQDPTFVMAGGYALTPGIPEDFFNRWLEQNKDQAFVRSGLVFANVHHDRVADRAREQVATKSGMEPIDPSNPPPGFRKGSNGGIERFDKNA